jgi:hypothetical protein
MIWIHTPPSDITTSRYTTRSVFCPTDKDVADLPLRILVLRGENKWAIRWGSNTIDRHRMPVDTPLEEVQAMAITLWKMK